MAAEPSDWKVELSHSWPLLGGEKGPGVATAPLALTLFGSPVLIGIDADSNRHLLVPQREEISIEDRRSAYVQITTRQLAIADKVGDFVDVTCTRRDLFDLFDDVVTDILRQLVEEPQDPGAICVSTLDRWRELLRRGTEPLSEQAVRGLFAELTVLRKMLDVRPSLDIARVWTGPTRAPHDFELTGHCLEVKALGQGLPVIEVHGALQLAQDAGKDLHLVALTLAEEPDGKRLADLASDVLAAADDPDELRGLLLQAGHRVSRQDPGPYRSYSVVQTHVLPVTEGFPRIVPTTFPEGDLPAGISGISYLADLTLQLGTSLDEREFNELIADGVLS